MFKAFKYSILAGVALALVGCTKATVEVVPNIEKQMFKFLVLLNYFTITHTHTLPFFFRKMSNEHSDNFSIKLSSDTKMENGYPYWFYI